MGALNRSPGIVLGSAEFRFFIRMPTNGGGIEENVCALKGSQAGAFRVPLVPADERADAAGVSVKGLEAEIAGGEVKLFVVERVVRDVHLAIEAVDAAVGIEDDGAVVVEAAGAALKERDDEDDLAFAGDYGQRFRSRAGHGLREIEERGVFALAEVLCTKKLGQADDLRALLRGRAHLFCGPAKIVVRVGGAGHLNQADGE